MGRTARQSGAPRGAAERIEQLEDRAFELSDREEHYRQLAEAAAGRERAEALSRAKSHLLATASHEVRTPLSGILGLADLLLDSGLTAEQESFARAVRSSGELMLRLLDDMLDFAKLEAGRFDLDPHPAELEPMVQDIVELLASRAHGKGLDLAAYVAPEARQPVEVDLPRLRQVLINLIANAIKFTGRGGVRVHVAGDAGTIRFAVEDSGPGVMPADADRIFGPLELAIGAGRSQGTEGSGLGLAISRQIIAAMGSALELRARPAGGSVFSFAIPAPAAGLSARRSGLAPLAGRRVLLVAPPGTEAEVICRHLADEGAASRNVADAGQAAGLAAAAAAAGEGYEAVLIDARIGPEPAAALQAMRAAAGQRLPAAVMVPPGRRRNIEEMRTGGFDAYLVRPVRRASLQRIAERLLESGGGFEEDPGGRRPATPVTATRHGLRVLLAEDDEINALLLRSVLRRFGHDVVEVGDGEAAVPAAADAGLGLAFIDLHMPKQDGFAAARAIRTDEQAAGRRRLLLVAISADPRPLMRDQALAAGFDRFLPKPIDPDGLRDILDEAGARKAQPAG